MIEKSIYVRLLKIVLVFCLLGYSLYVSIFRLKDSTMFNILLVTVVVMGYVGVIIGLFKKGNTKLSLTTKKVVLILNSLCWICLILLVISSITDLLTWSKQTHTFLFILAAILFTISTAIKFSNQRKLNKKR